MYIFKLLLSGHFPSSDITIPEHIVFLSLDPDPGDADDILTQNGYAYANNNPVMYVGPDGNKSKRNNPADTVLSATTALVSLVTALREMGIYFLRVSWHAAERMVERKVVSKMIAKAIKHGKVYYDPWYGSYVYYYNGLAIAVTKDKIITTIYWGKPKKKMDKNKITRLEGRSLKNVVITKEPIK